MGAFRPNGAPMLGDSWGSWDDLSPYKKTNPHRPDDPAWDILRFADESFLRERLGRVVDQAMRKSTVRFPPFARFLMVEIGLRAVGLPGAVAS